MCQKVIIHKIHVQKETLPKDFLNESYTDSENTQQATEVFKEKISKD